MKKNNKPILMEVILTVESKERLNEISQDIHTILSECDIENSVVVKSEKFCEDLLSAQIEITVTVKSVEKAKEIAHDLHETLNEAYNAENTIKVADTIFTLGPDNIQYF